jgi:hypothetical protein
MHFVEKENIVLAVSLVVGSQERRIVARKLVVMKARDVSYQQLAAVLVAY